MSWKLHDTAGKCHSYSGFMVSPTVVAALLGAAAAFTLQRLFTQN
jgi:hypothetical protein